MRVWRLESRSFRSVGVLSLLLLLATTVSLVISPRAEAKHADYTPPSFAGLKSAHHLRPGPDRRGDR